MKKPTRTRRSILARPKNELRRLNLSEKVKRSLSLKGAYYVPKGTKVTKQTAYVTVSSWRDAQLGIPHGKAAKLREGGRLGYGARGEERAIPQSVLTRISHRIQRAQGQYDSWLGCTRAPCRGIGIAKICRNRQSRPQQGRHPLELGWQSKRMWSTPGHYHRYRVPSAYSD
jgi:hypothetical protein